MNCPLCNHDSFDPGLTINTSMAVVVYRGEVKNLTPEQTIILAALHRRFALITSIDSLLALLYGGRKDGGPDTAAKILQVQICFLRKRLKGWPYKIINHHGHGYSLIREQHAAVENNKHAKMRA